MWSNSSNDFGKNIIPNMLGAGEKLMAYRFAGYWKDVGTIDSLWDANMDLLAGSSSGLDTVFAAVGGGAHTGSGFNGGVFSHNGVVDFGSLLHGGPGHEDGILNVATRATSPCWIIWAPARTGI